MNLAFKNNDMYYHGFTAQEQANLDTMIRQMVSKPTSEIRTSIASMEAITNPNEGVKALLAALKAEMAKRDSGQGPTKGITEAEKFAATVKKWSDTVLLNYLSSQERQQKNITSTTTQEQKDSLAGRINILKEEAKVRGIGQTTATKTKKILGMPPVVVYIGGGLLGTGIFIAGTALTMRFLKNRKAKSQPK